MILSYKRKGLSKMEFKRAVQELKGYIQDYAEEMLIKSKSKGQYECIFCGSGTGTNGTGALTIYPTSFYCFSCQKSGDIFDLIQQTERISKNKVIQYAAKKYGIHIDNTAKREENIDYTSFYRECNKHLQDTNYHRGISLETLNRFLVGYAAQWQHPKAPQSQPTPRLIIPTSKTSYLARDTRKTAEISENQKNYTKSKVGSVHIFNEKALQVNDIVYIVEGELDTLSIIDVGGNAVGLGSVSNINSFFKAIDCNGRAKQQKFIISLDNDKVGEKYKNALIEGLHKRCIKYCVYNPSGNYKDSNESLMNNREEFSKSVKYGIENIDRLIDEYKQQKNLDYNRKYSAKILFEDFIDGIADSVNTEVVPTGFKALDEVLDGGLYEGLYSIGAISSLGKTTFVLQMADQIAERGHEVLIFSLEMSRNELMAKSVSRNTIKRVIATRGEARNAKTTRGIMTGKKYAYYNSTEKELIKGAMNDYNSIADKIFIREGMGDVTADTIVEQVKEHIDNGNKPPVVIIDYLQILMPHQDRGTDKSNTDYAILTFKRLSRDYKIPVVVISSFNRENYSNRVSMQAFKESGAIEYSTDVLIGLQLQGVGTENFDVNQAKRQEPRQIEAVILKNRNGRTGDKIGYDYYAMFNYFSENGNLEQLENSSSKTNKRKKSSGYSDDSENRF